MASSSSSSPEISSADPTHSFSYKDATKDEVLEDLSSRFILNLPDEELASLERLCFQVEQAHWFYEDFIREQNTKLPSLPLKKFSEMLFHACPLLHQWSDSHEQAFNEFMQYKTRVPVCGAIMLNDAMDKCVLVKGWKASSGWGFPKGKINQVEPPPTCAIREVLEETGYNLAGQLDPNNVIELSIKEQKISLYIVPGVPEDFPFKTKTRKEISKIQWFKLSDLPTWKRNKTTPGRFYLISPFIAPLRAFINQRKPRNNPRKTAKQKKLPATTPHMMSSNSQNVDSHAQNSNSQPHTVNGAIEALSMGSSSVADANSLATFLDPHMSRLLSSLTLSATSIASNAPQNGPDHTNDARAYARASSPRLSDGSVDSPTVTHATEQLDWSSSVPPNFSKPSPQSPGVSSPTLKSSTEPSNSLAGSSTPLPQPTSNGFTKPTEGNSSRAMYSNIPSPTTASSPYAVPSAIVVPSSISPPTQPPMVSPTSPTSRRSSTADISPYLTRATAIPTSAKKLQQLSLLESIANESEKLAPIIAARAAMVSRGPGGGQYPPPALMQPQTPVGSLRDVGVLYSSVHPPPPASAAGFHPHSMLDNSGPGYHDPFQVRARTSQAFHRPPMHNPTGSVSFNQNQLLATINSRLGPQMNPQLMHEQLQAQPFNNGPQQYYPQVNRQYAPQPQPPMHGYNAFPSNQMPHPPPSNSFRPHPNIRPEPNHIPNPVLNMGPANMRNPTSVSLLSILNGRPSQQPAVPGTVHQ